MKISKVNNAMSLSFGNNTKINEKNSSKRNNSFPKYFAAQSIGAIAGYFVPKKPIEGEIINDAGRTLNKVKTKAGNKYGKWPYALIGAFAGTICVGIYDYFHNRSKNS